MKLVVGFAGLLAGAVTLAGAGTDAFQTSSAAEPLAIARILAAKYPAQPIMSYIPALSWSNSLRLAELTGETQWREKPLEQMQAFIAERTPAIAEPYRLTSLAGALAFADAGSLLGNRGATLLAAKVAYFMLPDTPGTGVKFATGWTDDMFMASAVLSRVGNDIPTEVVSRLLIGYAGKLQRPDGIYMHATDGPHAWGRGNGFALLGVAEALTHLPAAWRERAQVLEIYRKHVSALVTLQSDDGSWRQVVDEPSSYPELTVTAMTTAAMARGVRLGWIDRAAYEPIVNRGWNAVAARVNPDGTVRDVCSGTGVGPTKDYYLNRPVVNGADDRGGAMALLAAIEVEQMRRAR
ncbi:MAG: glycoside hydrolase family 88 protein [Vicinamibacterales bacterium]